MHLNHLVILSAITSATIVSAGHGKGGDHGWCGSDDAAWSTITDYPTPDDSLKSFLSSQTLWSQWSTLTDPCVVPAVTGSLAGEYTSWVSSVYSWQSEHESDFSSAWASCSDSYSSWTKDWPGYGYGNGNGYGGFGYGFGWGGFPYDATSTCNSLSWATATPTAGSSSDDSSSDTDSNQTANDNAAPRETGMTITAILMASVVMAMIIM